MYYNAILDIVYMVKFYQFLKIDYIVEVIIGLKKNDIITAGFFSEQ